MLLDDVSTPVILAPLAGGPSTPELTAGVAETGALAFLAAGYLSAEALAERMAATRRLIVRPFAVNLFVPGRPSDARAVERYARVLAHEARRMVAPLGSPRFDDDDWPAKLDLLTRDPVPVVSFTFGCPPEDAIARLHGVGSEVWVTVTSPDEAGRAEAAGCDVLVVQGLEAGGHRGSWEDGDDDHPGGFGLLGLLQLLRAGTELPLVATGGIATGAAIAAVLALGARAAALGTAFLRCPEAGTSDVHRRALEGDAGTALTRAFTGRTARGIRNRFLDEYSAQAPSAYPEVHHLTAPLRQAGRQRQEGDVVNLWAGQAYPLVRDRPAGDLVRDLTAELEEALDGVTARIGRMQSRRG
jgi:nitronate monooxygenase